MTCPLCQGVMHAGRSHDFRAFLRRLPTADRERLLREATATREPDAPAPSGRWLGVDDRGRIRAADPQCANHSEPSHDSRQDA